MLELVIEGNKVNSRGSAKQHKKKSIDSNNVSVSNLPPLENKITLTNRPQSRLGNLAFDVVLCPETANVKRRPDKLAQLEMKSMERRKKKKKRSTKPLTLEEWEAKQKQAEERRKVCVMFSLAFHYAKDFLTVEYCLMTRVKNMLCISCTYKLKPQHILCSLLLQLSVSSALVFCWDIPLKLLDDN